MGSTPQDRGLQEISDAIDHAVDAVDDGLDEHADKVSAMLRWGEAACAALQRHNGLAKAAGHALVLLYGPALRKTVLFCRMWGSVGWPAIRPSLLGLRDEYWQVREEKKKNQGKMDMGVLLAAVDPQRLSSLFAGLLAGVTTCLLHLRSPYLQILQAGSTLGEYIAGAIETVAGPVIRKLVDKAEAEGRLPPDARAKVDLVLGYLWTLLGIYITNRVRGPMLAGAAVLHSARVLAKLAQEHLGVPPGAAAAAVAHALTAAGLYNVFVRGGVQQLPGVVRVAFAPLFAFESLLTFGVGVVADAPAEPLSAN